MSLRKDEALTATGNDGIVGKIVRGGDSDIIDTPTKEMVARNNAKPVTTTFINSKRFHNG